MMQHHSTTTGSSSSPYTSSSSTTGCCCSIPFSSTSDLYDLHFNASVFDDVPDTHTLRIPNVVTWRSYGGVSKFSGVAVTLQCNAQDSDNSRVRELLQQQSSSIGNSSEGSSQQGQGRVLVVDAGGISQRPSTIIDTNTNSSGRSLRAFLGDQLALLAAQNGWSGVVIYGCVRDASQLRNIPIGILALGTTPRKTLKRGGGKNHNNNDNNNGGQANIPIYVDDAQCSPGDYVFCDADGVVFMDPYPLPFAS